jgi:hypothetical protein
VEVAVLVVVVQRLAVEVVAVLGVSQAFLKAVLGKLTPAAAGEAHTLQVVAQGGMAVLV